jgi:polyphosphate kinase 2
MEKINLNNEELEVLNSKSGLKRLISYPTIDLKKTIRYVNYENYLEELQVELIQLHNWVINNNKKMIILFEGRDSAGKGGAIRRMTEHINHRYFDIVALPKPDEVEKGQWYFQRYVKHLPKEGEIVFFDRSWYNRAIVEPVNGFCTEEEYHIFMKQVNNYEKMITESGTILIKFYFSISKDEQAKRFEEIKNDPLKKWKMTPVDANAQRLWDVYTKYKKAMYKKTNSKFAPWKIIKANRKTKARIAAIEHLLTVTPYENKNEELLSRFTKEETT